MEAVLSIAGSDSSGGAGIQADIKTIAAHRLFAETAITALTAQNTLGVTGVLDVDPAFVAKQIDAVFEDIRPAAVKVGMVSSAAIIEAVADALERHAAANIVVDPVMVATSGARLIGDDAIEALKERLLPLADVVTPNMPEAAVLCGFPVNDDASMERAANELSERVQGAVLVKGGHSAARADDVLVARAGAPAFWLRAPRVDTQSTHGTGCTLSSAIACGLAKGLPMEEAVRAAKDYVRGALAAGLNLGKGSGPLDHMWEY
ncbi:bifunctional hydroxymethylpyrimidine kinase/phosphomethylpyrimidine kinase [Eggerthella lenta]|uniref:bifunctional hydroxymethylpyrimidine kinase/phosphomethylpyrimidine kinase n=1 Tax=Eggerthella lenta TaxID=84112 RepID=UPI0012EDEFE2|nr:bifunctional hydroxymethylpyrimidine kinase/phosphomethylpyrimidine kinase [Eggerthella lenta]MVM49707.1 bifunctional hydroxymethylpyrimidine kinase/phosphomethylpyrimidine kinase [Eggerthella lenta]MVN30220.1 bifunctional hydroxymethylpyrimidine kinase/phosphomethylpyrimidine kinase [Eggerthella lenta]MVN34461.1 bifunctional hydroxymethylpyrimidine kinase/phosphomethylpyrimidine kinase [Eggerthella lenta]